MTELVIDGENKKLDTREDVEYIVQQIRDSEDLTLLKLSGNSFGIEASKAIGECIVRHPHLERALWSDMFVSRLKTEIPQALTCLGEGLISGGCHLVELDLSDNAFGPTGVKGIRTLLTSNVCYTIKILKFNNNGLGIQGGKILSQALLECHQEAAECGGKFALEVFEAGRNRLENEGAEALAGVFETIGTLVEVSMPQNGICHEGIAALAKAFGNNVQLQIINLSDNTFSEEGSAAMAQVLPLLQKLRIINFGECLVRSRGAAAIAESIQDNHMLLEELNLSFGDIDLESGLKVVMAISNKEQLRSIDLNGNLFGQGVDTIRDAMESKGRIDALGSLSEDEGSDDDDEGAGSGEEAESDDDYDNKENQCNYNNTVSSDGHKVSYGEWLSAPSQDNLVGLGDERWKSFDEDITDLQSTSKIVSLYVKVTSSYSNKDIDSPYGKIVHKFIDKYCESICRNGLCSELLNEIFVYTGLIKSEDKSFQPVKAVDGPLHALCYFIEQPYFPKSDRDIVISFISKPNTILDSRTDLRHHILSVLHNS